VCLALGNLSIGWEICVLRFSKFGVSNLFRSLKKSYCDLHINLEFSNGFQRLISTSFYGTPSERFPVILQVAVTFSTKISIPTLVGAEVNNLSQALISRLGPVSITVTDLWVAMVQLLVLLSL
jgi:hypothetical protein